MNVILSVEGMSCSACSSSLEKYLKKQIDSILRQTHKNINSCASTNLYFYVSEQGSCPYVKKASALLRTKA